MKAICNQSYILRSSFEPPVLDYARMDCQIVDSPENAPPPKVPAVYLQDVINRFKGDLSILNSGRLDDVLLHYNEINEVT